MHESLSMRELLERLRRREDSGVASDRAIRRALSAAISEEPWYIRTIAAAGAWMTAVMFVGFLACSSLIQLEGPTPYVWGVIFMGVGNVLDRTYGEEGIYKPQFALASSLTGQLLLVGGMIESFGLVAAAIVYVCVAMLLYVTYPRQLHRFLSSLIAIGLATSVCLEYEQAIGPLIGLFAIETLIISLVFTPHRTIPLSWRVEARPLGYAAALGLVGISSELWLTTLYEIEGSWPYRGIVAAGLIYLLYRSVKVAEQRFVEPAIWGGGAIVLLSVISTPGILVSMMILYLGMWRGLSPFILLGVVALGYHVGEFYYTMSTTLWVKAWSLIGSGVVLLALRWWFRHRPWMTSGGSS